MADIPRINSGSEKIFEIWSTEISAFWASKFTYANYTCIWNKRRKKRTKNKKLLTIIYHYLVLDKRNNFY
jgi:hypothetical protein